MLLWLELLDTAKIPKSNGISVMKNAIYGTLMHKSASWQQSFVQVLDEKNVNLQIDMKWNKKLMKALQAEPQPEPNLT